MSLFTVNKTRILLFMAALHIALLGSVGLAQQHFTPPSWCDEKLGITFHSPGYPDGKDTKFPFYANPFYNIHYTFEGHGQKLAQALAIKMVQAGLGGARFSVQGTQFHPDIGDYSPLDHYSTIVNEFIKQGIFIVFQLDGAPEFHTPLANDGYYTGWASQTPNSVALGAATPETDLAVCDEIFQRIVLPAKAVTSLRKPSTNHSYLVVSGALLPNEPRYYPYAGHSQAMTLHPQADRVLKRFHYLNTTYGNNCFYTGGAEDDDGHNQLNGEQPNTYVVHAYPPAPGGQAFPVGKQLGIATEIAYFVPMTGSCACFNYYGFQRNPGYYTRGYVAHLVDDMDMGGRNNGQGPCGKIYSDTQPRTLTDLNRDTWEEPTYSIATDLKQGRPWMANNASGFVPVLEDRAIVITNNQMLFHKNGTHPGGSSWGYPLPSDNFSYDIHIRNIGDQAVDVTMSADHNFNSLTFSPSSFNILKDGVQTVSVTFDCSNTTREGLHAAQIKAQVTGYPIEDSIPLVVVSDCDAQTTPDERLINGGTGPVRFIPAESTAYLPGQTSSGDISNATIPTEGSVSAVYEISDLRKAFALSHLRFYFGGHKGSKNWGASVTVDVWDREKLKWDENRALVMRVDGNLQENDYYSDSITHQVVIDGRRYVQMDLPVRLMIPLLSHAMGFDNKPTGIQKIRVNIRSADIDTQKPGCAHDLPESRAWTVGFEMFGKTFNLDNSIHIMDTFTGAADSRWTQVPAFSVVNDELVASGAQLQQTSISTDQYHTAVMQGDMILQSSDWAGLRFLMDTPNGGPWGGSATGYMLRLTPNSGNTLINLTNCVTGAGPQQVTVNGVDPSTAMRNLKVMYLTDPGATTTSVKVFYDNNSTPVMNHLFTGADAITVPGYNGLCSYKAGATGVTRFDNVEINPAPRLSVPEGCSLSTCNELVFYADDVDFNGGLDLLNAVTTFSMTPNGTGTPIEGELQFGVYPIFTYDPVTHRVGVGYDAAWINFWITQMINYNAPNIRLGIRAVDSDMNDVILFKTYTQ